MDRFPEAFERYEEMIDTDNIETFDQLLISVRSWGKERITLTRKQKRAIGKSGKDKLGIKPVEKVRITYEKKQISYVRKGKTISYTRKGKVVEMLRDVTTGKFAKRTH